MNIYLFTYHAYLSWLPDRPQGYVVRKTGILPRDDAAATRYRTNASEEEFSFTKAIQELLIETVLTACEFQRLTAHFIATEPTHVHALVSWTTDRKWQVARNGLKSSMTRALKKSMGDREKFFSAGSSRKQIVTQKHFDFHMNEYLPKHSGLKWREDVGMFQ